MHRHRIGRENWRLWIVFFGQVVTDYTNVNTENSSVCVYVRARPPDPGWTLEDDDASVEDKFQNPLQATLAGTPGMTVLRGGLKPHPVLYT